jgi:hypothetical protein
MLTYLPLAPDAGPLPFVAGQISADLTNPFPPNRAMAI